MGFEGIYEVSDLGNVRSSTTRRNTYKGRVLKPKVRGGYLRFGLTNLEGKTRWFTGSRLVAQHFIPNPEDKPHVNHKDGNKKNNAVPNLEWATESENVQHAHDTGLNLRGEQRHLSKLKKEDIPIIRALLAEGYSGDYIARQFGVSGVTIYSIKNKKSWKWV